MKRLNVWLVGLSIVVPAMLAFSAGGDTRAKAEKELTPGQLLGHVEWTADQKEKLSALKTAHEAQVKPLHDQLKQLELQIRALNEQFEKDVAALLTPDQIAAAKERFWKAEHRRMEERRLAEERRAEEGDRRPEEGKHRGPASRPADSGRLTDADKRLIEERRIREAERRDGDKRPEGRDGGTSTSRPAGDRRGERGHESEQIQQEIERLNHRLKELQHEEKELKETGN